MWHHISRCPYCASELERGVGRSLRFPAVHIPFFRCGICGKLIKTGAQEYLTMPVEERIKLRYGPISRELIEESLDRTNNQEYLFFLNRIGFEIYPAVDKDSARFRDVDFEKYTDAHSSDQANQILDAIGVLLGEDKIDIETGGFKEEIFKENKREYNIKQNITFRSSLIGLIVGIPLVFLFGAIDPNSYLFLIGIGIGLLAGLLTEWGMNKYYDNKRSAIFADKNKYNPLKETANKLNNNEKNEDNYRINKETKNESSKNYESIQERFKEINNDTHNSDKELTIEKSSKKSKKD